MKKLFVVLFIVFIALTGCKTKTGSAIAELTGVGDGKVSLVESIAINKAVTAGLAVVSDAAKPAIHVIAGGMLDKLDSNDAITVKALDAAIPQSVKDSGVTDELVLAEVNGFATRIKEALVDRLGITADADAQLYWVGIRAVLQAIYNQTGGAS